MTQERALQLNRDQLEDLKGIMREGFADFIVETLENMTAHMKNIETGLSQADMEKVHGAAHPLGSNSAYLGAQGVVELALKIEALADDQMKGNGADVAGIMPLFQELKTEFEALKPVLLKEAGAGPI